VADLAAPVPAAAAQALGQAQVVQVQAPALRVQAVQALEDQAEPEPEPEPVLAVQGAPVVQEALEAVAQDRAERVVPAAAALVAVVTPAALAVREEAEVLEAPVVLAAAEAPVDQVVLVVRAAARFQPRSLALC
jgi:hypothetical protein